MHAKLKIMIILMWRHFLVRKHKFIWTLLELCSTVAVFIFMYKTRSLIVNETPQVQNFSAPVRNQIIVRYVVDDSLLQLSTNIDACRQNNCIEHRGVEITGRANCRFKENVSIVEVSYVSDNVANKTTTLTENIQSKNQSEINGTVINMFDELFTTTAIVEFKKLSFRPSQLVYRIRLLEDQSIQLFSLNRILSSTVGPFFKSSLRLQWAIDNTYLQMLTGESISQELYLQELPEVIPSSSSLNVQILSLFLSFASLFGLFLPFLFTSSRLLEDRLTGVMELINMAGASRMMSIFSHFLNGVPDCLLYSFGGTLCLKVGNILPNSNGLLLFLMFVLDSMSMITTAMVTSFITNRKEYGTVCSIIIYLLLDSLNETIKSYISDSLLMLNYVVSVLLPKGPIHWFNEELFHLEQLKSGVTTSTMFEKHQERNLPVIWCYVMGLLQIILYFILMAYLTCVRPGPFGTAKPWNFLCKRKTADWVRTADSREQNPDYFEDAPEDKEVGVQVINVTKAYHRTVVVDDVSLDIYKGDITVLLGHNGAGKTTLMSIITGMTSPTSGEVLVNGKPSTHEIRRRDMGLCPQHNIFLPSLTVMEHCRFFAMLKGHSYLVAKHSSSILLEDLGLKYKAKTKSSQLSGGMKRRLQLACALSGDTSVLILDEPTSGLDVETRRELWDLLLKLRGSRTTLLSTHFMEEADALADRIAALSQGQLVCYATPIVLKSNAGTGYILTVSTDDAPNEPEITETVTNSVPEATLREVAPKSLTYNLPTDTSTQFPTMFKSLESQKEKLEINAVGVGMSTLEEVFHKLCSNVSYEEDEDAGPETPFKLIRPPALYCRQIAALLKRLVLYIWSSKCYFMFINTLLPLGVIYFFASLGDYKSKSKTDYNFYTDLDIGVENQPRRRVYFDVDDPDMVKKISDKYEDLDFLLSKNISADITKLGENPIMYINTLAGVKINSTTIQIFYSPLLYHAASDALNLASNAVSKKLSDNFKITTYYQDPPPVLSEENSDKKNFLMIAVLLMLKLFIVLLVFFISVISVDGLLKQEHHDNTRWLHIMAGCPVILHWLTRLLFHVIQYSLLLILPILLMFYFFEKSKIFTVGEVIGVFALIFLMSLLAWLAFIYLMSFTPLGTLILYVCVLIGVFIGILDALTKLGLRQNATSLFWKCVHIISWVFLPPDVGCNACIKSLYIAMKNEIQPNVTEKKYFEWGNDKPLVDIVYLAVQFLIEMALVICIEEGCALFNIANKLYGEYDKSHVKRYNDEHVESEKQYVEETIANPRNEEVPDVMLVNNIHKTYLKIGKPVHAVNGLSFSVKKGECFGLLGVNGAGKSTTFKMITAETSPTKGQIWANGHFLQIPRGRYLKSLGYCPQFLGVDGFLTGKQNLNLLLKIQGLSNKDIKRETATWLKVVGLERLQNLPVNTYSGGCKRRASTACSLCSAAPLTLMDEPTSGVDVTARRRVWYAVRRALRAKRAVVITSHSMDEMEALCGRVGIMSSGEMCALGSAPALRAQHAAGFSLRLKVSALPDAKENKTRMKELKKDLFETFKCRLKDQHGTMLHYHIDETMPYSDLFTKLEHLKERNEDYIENYTVSETTLEEVFLSFADKRKPIK